jgi:hypothetical protein
MSTSPTPAKNTTAFFAQAALSFGVALFAMLAAVYFLPAEPWVKAFLGLGTLFLVTSSFTLAKCIRDAQEDNTVISRVDRARLDKILLEHDPYKAPKS